MKILVVDDTKTSLLLVAAQLEKLGHEVTTTQKSTEAADLFTRISPDLVILDVVMDKMDGYEVARKLRKLSDGEDWVPIIFLSGEVDTESMAKGIEAGGDDYLLKPVDEAVLASKLKAFERIADMSRNLAEANKKLKTISLTDPLTGIPNRMNFEATVRRAIASAKRNHHIFAVLFVDLDGFKHVNDSLGHDVGDLLLKEIATRLIFVLRENDFVARLGGDEFAMILDHIKASKDAGIVAEKVLEIMRGEFDLAGHKMSLGCSIGVACYPQAGEDLESLMKHADLAMYRAKSLGKGDYQIYNESVDKAYSKQVSTENALRFALKQDEFSLVYQPIFDLKSCDIVGVEALLRWHHPKLGEVMPNDFISIAEEVGLIDKIGEWVLRESCRQYAAWQKEHGVDCKLNVAVNISPRQLKDNTFFNLVKAVLKEYHLRSEVLGLELTETSVMVQLAQSEKLLDELKNFGVSLAIDDFGTGYSSLSRLRKLSIDTLKIDASFVQDIAKDPDGAMIVKTIIDLAKNLKINVTAEGVETKAQLDFLEKNGCKQAQGFYLSKPLPPDEFIQLFQKQQKGEG
jgi:diguanylate cyclase (GGDEF)-like protein